jgi:hypothetical protein
MATFTAVSVSSALYAAVGVRGRAEEQQANAVLGGDFGDRAVNVR